MNLYAHLNTHKHIHSHTYTQIYTPKINCLHLRVICIFMSIMCVCVYNYTNSFASEVLFHFTIEVTDFKGCHCFLILCAVSLNAFIWSWTGFCWWGLFVRCIYGHVYDVCMFMSASVCVLPVEIGGQSQVPVLDFTLLMTNVLLFSSVTPRVDIYEC